MPESEVILWSQLQGKQLAGFKFRRQYGVGTYVVDFYCPQLKLAIEIDGDSHVQMDSEQFDRVRQGEIERYGIKLLRFTNEDVKHNLTSVLDAILGKAKKLQMEKGLYVSLENGGKGNN